MKKRIDLRSDTVTQPSAAMRQVMAQAEVGDDVYRDDPTVTRLEKYAAELLGFEAAIFTASGTQANLIGIMSHCERGDEYIVGQLAHTYKYEGGGAAVLGSIQPQPIEFEPDSTLSLTRIEEKIKPDDIHFARTRLLCLENTQNGKTLPLEYLQQAAIFARDKKLRMHLDGARLFNAVVKQNVAVQDITRHFIQSLSACQKDWGRRLAQFSAAPSVLSKRQESGEKWSAAVCGRREFLPQRAFTPWTTI
jgi:threonine aldolase